MNIDHENDLRVAGLLGELKASVDSLGARFTELRESFTGEQAKLETRVRKLEEWRFRILGGAAVLGYVAQYIPHPSF